MLKVFGLFFGLLFSSSAFYCLEVKAQRVVGKITRQDLINFCNQNRLIGLENGKGFASSDYSSFECYLGTIDNNNILETRRFYKRLACYYKFGYSIAGLSNQNMIIGSDGQTCIDPNRKSEQQEAYERSKKRNGAGYKRGGGSW